ncbi:FkbM family methyltransferase [Bradyrhizobium xenonodulans]|uniref:FkbM family methyltransferase n=1 Tax=Bradyrhizobium xenonodulans TaxID=2736875 RepID=A0ABY7MBQ1_9BRAD|nr:FkbM family methyltransferase [Bradyrhizobium xenonodulans]WBL75696.1 FkbM family methyltransferase [Bradyrhizobium xenonodulans]
MPPSLDAITTYVILEQEKWFEKEPAFLSRWLKPGMTALDIGANLGVYSLPMARMVGPEGQVFAYEPASEPRRLLALSKAKNGAANLNLVDAALSDGVREGRLVLGASSELNSLDGDGPSETIRITSLDHELRSRHWGSIDFVKIDAEGEEERILAGATAFFFEHSPLVMFEVKAGLKQNDSLPAAFAQLGFGIYRLLDGDPLLVPVQTGEPLDGYELNLFAAKPDRAAALAQDGLLIETNPQWELDDTARSKALALFEAQAFAGIFAALSGGAVAEDPIYRDALACYALWRSQDLAWPVRYAALKHAYGTLEPLCRKQDSLPRLSTLARIASDLGYRSVAVNVLQLVADVLKGGKGRIAEPFWPARPRFDKIAPGTDPVGWFVAAALEQLELIASYSSCFAASRIDLDWLAKHPLACIEIERRRVLQRARAGQKVEVPSRLLSAAPDNANAETWRSGAVPNTIVR